MPALPATARAIDTLKPPAQGRVDYPDPKTPGLMLRLSASGHRSWSMLYRPRGGGKPERVTLRGVTGYAEVRREALRLRGEVATGTNPQGERRADRKAPTFGKVVELYLAHVKDRLMESTYKVANSEVKRPLAKWADTPITRIERTEIIEFLNEVKKEAPVGVNRIQSRLSAIFGHAVDELGKLKASPAANIDARTKEKSKDRSLSDDEIRLVWAATALDGRFHRDTAEALRLDLLIGQRPSEITDLEPSELRERNDDDHARVEIGAGRMGKTKEPHVVPLVGEALAIVRAAAQRNAGAGSLFVTANGRPLTRANLAAAMRELNLVSPDGKRATPHDFRRTMSTWLNEHDAAPPHIVEELLAHIGGHKKGVAGTYNKAKYLKQKRRALEAWNQHVLEVVGANVVPFAATA